MAGRRFEDKVVLVTGGASGIGLAAATAFAREGAHVVVADLQEAAFEDGSLFVRCNVADEASVAAMLETVRSRFGRLDAAFNNAGIASGPNTTADCSRALWDRVIGINLTGVWLCLKHEIPLMLAGGGGAIVNNASIAGLVGLANNAAYVAAKHGVVGLTKAAALDHAAQNLRVNCVCPGVIDTPMFNRSSGAEPTRRAAMAAAHPLGRLGTAAEIAAAVLFLCSGEASFITGHALAADGGWVAQ
jgi:NAD(P)-dependent dehydrogenase (short-subunit alcohol dehydrogenase family)